MDDDGIHTDDSGLSRFFHDGSNPTDDVGNQMDQVDAAQNARITVDGFTAYSSTNEFSNVITGVTITALVDDGENGLSLDPPSALLDISLDKTKVKSAIEVFLTSYNELILVTNELTDYDPASETRGLLSGDSTLNNLETQVRRIFSNTVKGAAADLSSLSTLGVKTNLNGTVTLDSDLLATVISGQFDDIGALFSGDNGIASQLDSLLNSYLSAGGVFQSRENGFNAELAEVEDERATLEFRLEKIEARLRAQFASLDILVSQFNSTGNFLTQQLAAAADIINFKK
jgi:flagellar hook-associated protein 2